MTSGSNSIRQRGDLVLDKKRQDIVGWQHAGQFPVADVEQWLGLILLYWRLISQPRLYKPTIQRNFKCIELSTLVSAPGGNSPTAGEEHHHGFISELLYIKNPPCLARCSLLQLFHANVHSWYHSQAGNDGSWLITAAVSACPQLCVTLPLILHIFALLICACSGKFYLSPLAPILHAFSLPAHLIVSYCSSCIIIHHRDTNLPI